jgi:soluble lytic murein transglycosylase
MNILVLVTPLVLSTSVTSALSLRSATFDAREGRPYLEARRLEQSSEWDMALRAFEELASSSAEFADYALLGMGRCYSQLGRPRQARRALQRLLRAFPKGPAVPYARIELGRALAQMGLFEESAQELEQALGIQPSSVNKPEVLYALASTYVKIGMQDKVLRAFERVCRLEPRSEQALKSAARLAEAGNPREKLVAARTYNAQRQWQQAIGVCEQILDDPAAGETQQAEAMLELARGHRGAGNPSEALETYSTLSKWFSGSSSAAQALLESAAVNLREECAEQAVWIWQRLRNEYPDTLQAVQAQWELARYYDEAGDSESAMAQYAKLTHDHPTSFLADDAMFHAGVKAYISGNYGRAAEILVEATNHASDRLIDDAPYWTGKAYLAAGKTHVAAHYFSRAAQVEPAGFYSYRAWAALRELSMIGLARANRVALGDRWLMILPANASVPTARHKAIVAASPPADLGDATEKLARRAAFLIRYQLPEADWDLDKLSVANTHSGPIGVAQLFLSIGAFDRCLSIAEGMPANPGSQSSIDALLPYLYPLAHAERVRELASAAGVDPLLVHAVMREESRLSRTKVSSAGATGLMQVMPSTGRWIASQLGLEDYDDQSLYDRDINLALGIWYLGYLGKEFDGNIVHVLAGYNGGPGNVRRWLDAQDTSDDVDAFIESIPLTETRNYVKKVLGAYGNYLQVYR